MSNNFMNSKGLATTLAVGAGVLIGAAGFFIYEHFFVEKRRLILQRDVLSLEGSLSRLQKELDILRSERKGIYSANQRSVCYSVEGKQSRADVESELMTAFGSDSDEEFFDITDEDQITFLPESKMDLGAQFEEIDGMLNGGIQNKIKAYGILLDLNEKDEMQSEILWRLAKACHRLANDTELEGNTEKIKDYIEKGVQFAKQCLSVAPRSSDAHKWYAICIGARGDKLQGTRGKVSDGLEFIRHVEEALLITPNDPTLYHLHGRFKFEVASLSWIERKVAKAIFSELPEGTYEEAIKSLLRAEDLSMEPWKENRLLLAKCFIKIGQMQDASHWLNKGEECGVSTPEDQVADYEIKNLRAKYNL